MRVYERLRIIILYEALNGRALVIDIQRGATKHDVKNKGGVKVAHTSPFSGDSPLPKVDVTIMTKASCSRLMTS